MVRHPRIAHRIDVEEPHGRKQDSEKEKEARERPPPEAAREEKTRRGRQESGCGGNPLREKTRIDAPSLVDERELGGVKRRSLPREDDASREAQAPLLSGRPHHRPLEPRRVEGQGGAEPEERDERPDVRRFDPSLFPPDEDEKDGGDGAGRRLREEGEKKE